jgi:hypothetical protein
MMETISKIAQVYGMDDLEMKELPHALFYHCGFGLRFELAYGDYQRGDRIPSFLQAIDRARAITAATFPDWQKVTLMISQFGDRSAHTKRRVTTQLKTLGIHVAALEPAGVIAQEDQYAIAECGEDSYRHWFTLRVETPVDIDKLIWGCITKELHISPSFRTIEVYMLDLDRGIALQIYDDRGMDVVGNDLAVLRPLYKDLNAWIFDYDRKQIDKVFKTGKPIRQHDAEAARERRQSPPPEPGIYTITSIRD